MNRRDELTLKLLDQTATDDELAELVNLTKSIADRKAMLKLFELESHLHVSGQRSIAEPVLRRLQDDRRRRIEAGVMGAIEHQTSSGLDEATSPVVTGPRKL